MKRMCVAVAFQTLALFALAGMPYSKDLVLAERGKSSVYGIVLPENPAVWQKFAANELAAWTKRLTDVDLPISVGKGTRAHNVYLIEPEPTLNLGEDGFNIRVEKDDVYVRGGQRGVIYGVYEILETYGGIGWFSPDRTVVPATGVLKVPDSLYDTQRPALELRMTDWMWCGDRENTFLPAADKIAFHVRLRLNGSNDVGIPLEKGGLTDASRLVEGSRLCHTFYRLVPPKTYFKTHPEYFSYVDGERRAGEAQLCLTNPEVLEIVVSNVVKLIDADPNGRFYGVSQEDWERYCTCDKCRAVDAEEGSHAGTLIRFVNAVAEKVDRIRPGLWCETLAYQYTRKPPKTKPRENVMVCFCNIECDWSRPLTALATPANESFLKDFIGWSKLTRNLYFWDYTINYWWPFHAYPNLNSMQENIRFFRDYGVRWLFEEGGNPYADFAALKCWMLGRLMWNPDQSKEALLDKFFAGYYGAAALQARACFDRMHAELANASSAPGTPGLSARRLATYESDRLGVYSDRALRDCLKEWRAAEKAVADDPVALRHVRLGEAGTVATILDRAAAKTKLVWATAHPERFQTFEDVLSAYRWMQAWIEGEKNPQMKAFGAYNASNTWARAAKSVRPAEATERDIVAAGGFRVRHLGEWAKYADEAGTADGKSIRLLTVHDAPSILFSFANVAYDEGVDYRVRVRIRVDKVPGAKGEAFYADVTNSGLALGVKAEDITSDGYAWYDLGTVRPKDDMTFRCGIGRFKQGGGHKTVNAVFVDRLEISVATQDK